MTLPTIYNYHPDTGILLGSGLADPSPLEEGAWLIPGSATDIEPPAPQAGHVAVFDGTAWILKVDNTATNQQIVNAPPDLFGGPTIAEVLGA
jgi:hypothetical protein